MLVASRNAHTLCAAEWNGVSEKNSLPLALTLPPTSRMRNGKLCMDTDDLSLFDYGEGSRAIYATTHL